MSIDNPHFEIGHMCAGCPVSNILHTGCVVESSVVVKQNKVADLKKRIDKQIKDLETSSLNQLD